MSCASADFPHGVRLFSFTLRVMPEISRFYGIVIRMYFADHNPPHFHAVYGEHQAEFHIFTLEVIRGSLPDKANKLVIKWATLHRNELV